MMLTFSEFRANLCIRCTHCKHIEVNEDMMNFCYFLYTENPQKFVSHVYTKLINNPVWPKKANKESEIFRNIFCKSEICGQGKKCIDFLGCLTEFTLQITEASPTLGSDEEMLNNYLQKQYKKEITIIVGGSDKWKKMVQTKC
jgi:hypothetical protein